jgi:hypothetical protein
MKQDSLMLNYSIVQTGPLVLPWQRMDVTLCDAKQMTSPAFIAMTVINNQFDDALTTIFTKSLPCILEFVFCEGVHHRL